MTKLLLAMSIRDIDRYDILQQFIRKEIKRTHAAILLTLSVRQVSRLKISVVERGPSALIHGLRGKHSCNAIADKERRKIVRLITSKYHDFTPTFATEKLRENHGIDRDTKTVKRIMVAEGLLKPKKKRNIDEHRAWRQRRAAFGEMLQFDGSYHDWFEGRGGITESCLLATIDDATSKLVKAEFAPHEGIFPVFDFWVEYITNHGKPRQIYLDKFSTYKMNSAIAKDNPELKTQFGRAMEAIAIEPIFANSPQAKGRVERLFDTLQDRLVKELRLKNIATVKEANRFLKEIFIPSFNEKFSVIPSSNVNLHRELMEKERTTLPSIFSRHSKRTVQNDFTFSFKNKWHQLTEDQRVTICKKDIVTIEEWLDGSFHVRLRGKELNYKILPERPKRSHAPAVIVKTDSATWKPAADHPWRKKIKRNFQTTY